MKRKNQKKLMFFVVACMLLQMFAPIANFAADGTTWDGTITPFTIGGGVGDTADNPVIIDTAGKLAYLAQQVNLGTDFGYLNKFFKLTQNLDLANIQWTPIGTETSSHYFSGAFDGNGKTISNVAIGTVGTPSTLTSAGLFGYVTNNTAEIKNLTVTNIDYHIGDNACSLGGLVGRFSRGVIDNCYTSGTITGGSNGQMNAGGLVGYNNGGTIRNSGSSVIVTVSTVSSRAGGLVSMNYSMGQTTPSLIENCYATGNVTGGFTAGGLVGMNYCDSSTYGASIIKNCYASGNAAAATNDGGLVAYNAASGGGTATIDQGYWNSSATHTPNEVGIGTGSGTVTSLTSAEMTGAAGTGALVDILNANKGGTNPNWFIWQQSAGTNGGFPTLVQPDFTAPQLTAGAVSRTSDTTGTVKFTSNEAGQYYYAIVADAAAAPAIDTSGAGTACTTSETTITDPTGLTAGAKDIYIKVKDAAGNVSSALKIDISAAIQPQGTGTEIDPYLIASPGNLIWISENNISQSGFINKYLRQAQDIDMSSAGEFVPIGSMVNSFKGTYDGNNKKISNLYQHGSYNETGLFGVLNGGTIKNLTLEDVSISGTNWAVGGIVGYLSSGVVSNCHITKSASGSSTIDGTYMAGGAVIGGIAGENDATIEYCSNAAAITNYRSYAVGGIAGASYTSGSDSIHDCYNIGTVTGEVDVNPLGTLTGGIVGELQGNLSNCYNTGTVTQGRQDCIGGAVGNLLIGSVLARNFYLNTSASVGIGTNNTGIDYSTNAAAKTSDEMKIQNTYTNWNFTFDTGAWAISSSINSGYPFLQSMAAPEELANVSIATAKALIPSTLTVTEGVYTNFLTYLNGIEGMSDIGVTLTLASSNANITNDGAINYTSSQVTGNVVVHINKANGTEDTKTIAVTVSARQSGGSNYTAPTQNNNTSTDIIVNGKSEKLGTSVTKKEGDKTVTTVVLDQQKLEQKLEQEGKNTVVTIPVNAKSDVVVGELNGQTVKSMEAKEAVLEIKTENVTYTLPASQINIDNVSTQIGQQVELKDIKVNVKIAEVPTDMAKVVEDTANKNSYQVVVKPVEFNITCTSGEKTVEVSKFNGYVERTVAIPEGVDPSKITTGIVLNPDGTFSHVPTVITVIDGKYYAKINSLTNSTYSVIYSPKTFKDVETHWAKDDISDMASRLVVNGVGDGSFEPDRDITRAEFAAIVVKGLGLMRPGTGKYAFKDVEKSDWYYDAVSIANEYKLINGYADGKFKPQSKITREEAMAIISRAMVIAKLDANVSDEDIQEQLAKFTDSSDIGSWARNAVTSCVKSGVVNGSGGKVLAKDDISRAETAAVVRRMLQKAKLI